LSDAGQIAEVAAASKGIHKLLLVSTPARILVHLSRKKDSVSIEIVSIMGAFRWLSIAAAASTALALTPE
jgi:hypothetical protein